MKSSLLQIVLFGAAIALSAQAQYLGSQSCYACHTAIYNSYKKTAMGRSMTLASEWKPGTLPAQATVAQPGSARTFAVSRNEQGWVQSESEPGVFQVQHHLEYVVGSGENGLTFLTHEPGYLFQAPLSFYSRAGKWDLSPGYEQSDLGFRRQVPQECVNCHAGRASFTGADASVYAEPVFQELAIGCENCHGPGQAHVKAGGRLRGSIVNPAKLAPRLAENICLNCHQGGDDRLLQPGKSFLDFRPGQWLFDTAVLVKQPAQTQAENQAQQQADLLEHHSAMQASKCFLASQGKLSCLTCHDPHVEPKGVESAAYYKAKCLGCHSEQSCHLPLAQRTSLTPADDCVGCHMPKRQATRISHSALTNHRIPARDGEALPEVRRTQVDHLVVLNPPEGRDVQLSKMMLLRAYQDLAPRNPDYVKRYTDVLEELAKSQPDDPFVQASLGHKAFNEKQTEEAAVHLRKALPLGKPVIYLELGQALAGLGKTDEAIEYLKKGTALDPYNPVMQKTLILQYINSKSYTEARLLIQQYVTTFPEDALMRSILARLSK